MMPPIRTAGVCLAASTLLLLAGSSRCESAERWADQRVAGPFVCRADFSLTAIEGLLDDLARLQSDLVRSLGIKPTGEWIEIYLFNDQSTYRRYLEYHFPQVPYRRALFVKYQGPGIVLAYRSRQLEVDMRHECTHALLHATLPMVPLWLDEGLAEYFENPADTRAYENAYLSGVRWKARFGMAPNLEKLEKIGDISKMGADQYRDAWAWVHFMLHGSTEAQQELVRYMADIEASSPPGLLSRRLPTCVPDLQKRFTEHFKGWTKRP